MTSFLLHERYIMLKRTIASYMFVFATLRKRLTKCGMRVFEMGIDLHLWKIVVKFHDNLSSYIIFRGFKSSKFNISRGTRKGSSSIAFLVSLFHK